MARRLEMRRKLLGPHHEQVAMSLSNLGDALEQNGDLAAAAPALRGGPPHPAEGLRDREPALRRPAQPPGGHLAGQGDLGRAESLAREGMELRRNALGTAHADSGRH